MWVIFFFKKRKNDLPPERWVCKLNASWNLRLSRLDKASQVQNTEALVDYFHYVIYAGGSGDDDD